jgi:hypothetical protein
MVSCVDNRSHAVPGDDGRPAAKARVDDDVSRLKSDLAEERAPSQVSTTNSPSAAAAKSGAVSGMQ